MTDCCADPKRSPLETLPAGLESLPRQVVGFPEVRTALLASLGRHEALAAWRPSGNDFGLMWLEMWAYVADLLGFYDERIANESYLRTAVRAPSLRRIVGLLGYKPLPGVAGSATVAALAEGNVAVGLPAGTRFRSRGFDGQPPQVFETGAFAEIHPLKNTWTIAPFKRRPTVDAPNDGSAAAGTFADAKGKDASAAGSSAVDRLLFEPEGFGLAVDDLILFDSRDPEIATPATPAVTRVTQVVPFAGKDGASYIQVTFDPAVTVEPDFDLTQLRVRKPIRSRTATANKPVGPAKQMQDAVETVSPPSNGLRVYFDGPPEGFRRSDPVIVARSLASFEPDFTAATVHSVSAAAVRVDSIPPQPLGDVTVPSPSVVAMAVVFRVSGSYTLGTNGEELSFHFDFVDGGVATNVARTKVTAADLTAPGGVPISGVVVPPPDAEAAALALGQGDAVAGILEQVFLVSDAAKVGVLLNGRMTFARDGRAAFEALDADQLPAELRFPLSVYGNVVGVIRGESVTGEVLGNGNARIANQRFKLKNKPLTYLYQPSDSNQTSTQSTLQLYVDGLLWAQVRSFFGCGPADKVYVVDHDDEQNTVITGGDGIRGARFPTGIANIVARYRVGSGFAAPPAGAINQLAGAVKGLRGVVSPLPGVPGKDADRPDDVRETAPRSALLLGRAVSAADFAAIAADAPGVVRASADWLWVDAQMQAGVHVRYIGETTPDLLAETLRLHADPTVPLEITRAVAIPSTMSVSVEVDPRFSRETVAAAVAARLRDPVDGVLSLRRAAIGGPFHPSAVYRAVSQVDGVVCVSGMSVATPAGGPTVSNAAATCLAADKYLDFTAPDAVAVVGVEPVGMLPPAPQHGGAEP